MAFKQTSSLIDGKLPVGKSISITSATINPLATEVEETFATISLDSGVYIYYYTLALSASGANATGVFLGTRNTIDTNYAGLGIYNQTMLTTNSYEGNRCGFLALQQSATVSFSVQAIYGGAGSTLNVSSFQLYIVKVA